MRCLEKYLTLNRLVAYTLIIFYLDFDMFLPAYYAFCDIALTIKYDLHINPNTLHAFAFI